MNDRDRAARFNARYRDDYVPVLRFVERRVADDQSALDIVAEVFVRLWSKDTGAEPLSRGWLFTTATHLIGHHYRTSRRKHIAEQTLQVLAVATARELPTADIMILRDALSTLTPRQRDIVALTYWDGLSAPEIAELLGMTTSAVWTTVSRAREMLRRQLAPEEVRGEEIKRG